MLLAELLGCFVKFLDCFGDILELSIKSLVGIGVVSVNLLELFVNLAVLFFNWLCWLCWVVLFLPVQVKPCDRGISLAQVGGGTAAMRDTRSETLPNGKKTPPKVSNSDSVLVPRSLCVRR